MNDFFLSLRKIRVSHLLIGVFSLCLLAALTKYLSVYWAFFSYPYDWDPGDGDMLNVVSRIRHGLSAYLDWRDGKLTTVYTPLLHYLVALISTLGLEPMGVARTLNTFSIPLSVVASGMVFQFALGRVAHDGRAVALGAIVAGAAALSAWPMCTEAFLFRPDPFGLFLSLLCCTVLAVRPENTALVASLAVAAALTKQSFAPVGIGALAYYLLYNRRYAIRFIVQGAIISGASVGLLEYVNRGNFLRSTLQYPGRFYEENGFLLWSHYRDNLLAFHGGRFWVTAFGGIGLALALRRRSPLAFVALIWLVDFAIGLKSWRQIGGMRSYLWLHWFLLSVLAGYGCFSITQCMRRNKRIGAIVLPTAFATVMWIYNISPIFKQARFGLENETRISETHEQIVRGLDPENRAQWVTNRFSATVVRAGNVLDHELCSLGVAFSSPRVPEGQRFVERFRDGEFKFFQTGVGLAVSGLQEVLDACFVSVAKSNVIFAGGKQPIEILAYDGDRPECTSMQREKRKEKRSRRREAKKKTSASRSEG